MEGEKKRESPYHTTTHTRILPTFFIIKLHFSILPRGAGTKTYCEIFLAFLLESGALSNKFSQAAKLASRLTHTHYYLLCNSEVLLPVLDGGLAIAVVVVVDAAPVVVVVAAEAQAAVGVLNRCLTRPGKTKGSSYPA